MQEHKNEDSAGGVIAFGVILIILTLLGVINP